MNNERYLTYIALANNPEIGAKTILKLDKLFNNKLENIWKHNNISKIKDLHLTEKIRQLIKEIILHKNPKEEYIKIKKLGIDAVTLHCDNYPMLLKEIADPPAVLYFKGKLNNPEEMAIAIVGARKYTSYGKQVVEYLVPALANAGLTIISGLALGIDAFAHKAAVELKRRTIGVLGCGVDKIYPMSNYYLAKQMLETNGAIISEYPPGTPPYKSNFPLRNRIIAGMSLGVVVAEAAEKSGTLLTAKSALDYNRQVFAVPASIFSDTSVGANNLIKYGAKLVNDANDIISELNLETKINEQKAKRI